MQVVDALAEGRVDRQRAPQALRDVRLSTVVTGVRLLEGGVGVEVDVQDQVRSFRESLMKGVGGSLHASPAAGRQAVSWLGAGTQCRAALCSAVRAPLPCPTIAVCTLAGGAAAGGCRAVHAAAGLPAEGHRALRPAAARCVRGLGSGAALLWLAQLPAPSNQTCTPRLRCRHPRRRAQAGGDPGAAHGHREPGGDAL